MNAAIGLRMRTEDGYTFTVRADGSVGDGDLEWPDIGAFLAWAAEEGTALTVLPPEAGAPAGDRRTRAAKTDAVAIRTAMSDALDALTKQIIPGRSPWQTSKAAKKWFACEYLLASAAIAREWGISVSAAQKIGPGVLPYHPEIASRFKGGA